MGGNASSIPTTALTVMPRPASGHYPIGDMGSVQEIYERLDKLQSRVDNLERENEGLKKLVQSQNEELRMLKQKILELVEENKNLKKDLRQANGSIKKLLKVVEEHGTTELKQRVEETILKDEYLREVTEEVAEPETPKRSLWKTALLLLVAPIVGIVFFVGRTLGSTTLAKAETAYCKYFNVLPPLATGDRLKIE